MDQTLNLGGVTNRKYLLAVNIICCLLIFLFIYASVSKLIDFDKFKIQIGQSPLLTTNAILFAWSVPALEIIISFFLALSRTRLLGLYLSYGLMILFSAYITAILNFSVFVPCSCGGILQNMTWTTHLVFNLFFVTISAVGIFLEERIKYTKQFRISESR